MQRPENSAKTDAIVAPTGGRLRLETGTEGRIRRNGEHLFVFRVNQ